MKKAYSYIIIILLTPIIFLLTPIFIFSLTSNSKTAHLRSFGVYHIFSHTYHIFSHICYHIFSHIYFKTSAFAHIYKCLMVPLFAILFLLTPIIFFLISVFRSEPELSISKSCVFQSYSIYKVQFGLLSSTRFFMGGIHYEFKERTTETIWKELQH